MVMEIQPFVSVKRCPKCGKPHSSLDDPYCSIACRKKDEKKWGDRRWQERVARVAAALKQEGYTCIGTRGTNADLIAVKDGKIVAVVVGERGYRSRSRIRSILIANGFDDVRFLSDAPPGEKVILYGERRGADMVELTCACGCGMTFKRVRWNTKGSVHFFSREHHGRWLGKTHGFGKG